MHAIDNRVQHRSGQPPALTWYRHVEGRQGACVGAHRGLCRHTRYFLVQVHKVVAVLQAERCEGYVDALEAGPGSVENDVSVVSEKAMEKGTGKGTGT